MILLLALLLSQTPVKVTNVKADATAAAVRCVNAAGTAFESCGGSGSTSWFPDGGVIGIVNQGTSPWVISGAVTLSAPSPVSGTLTAAAQTVALTFNAAGHAAGILITGTWVGTIVFEASPDGSNWGAYETFNPITTAETVQSNTTVNGFFTPLNTVGLTQVRVRASAWTSGTANILIVATGDGDDFVKAVAKENGTTAPGYGLMVGGSDGTNLRYLRTAADGTLRVDPTGTTPQPVSGTLTCNAGTGTLAVSGPLTDAQLRASAVPVSLASTTITGTVAATQSGAWSLSANQSVNVSQINAVTPLMGVGASGTGALRTASLIHDGTTVAGVIAGTTALKTDLSSVAGTATVTAAAGVAKVGVVGNANAAFDAANNAAAPANVLMAGIQLRDGTTATAGTVGQVGNAVGSLDHVLYTRPGGPVNWSCFVPLTTTATTQCRAAPAAGIRAYVTSINCSNGAATVQGVDIVFGTGAACVTGITALTHKLQMGTNALTTSPFQSEAEFITPLVPTAANAICVRPTAATAFGCTLTGFDAP